MKLFVKDNSDLSQPVFYPRSSANDSVSYKLDDDIYEDKLTVEVSA